MTANRNYLFAVFMDNACDQKGLAGRGLAAEAQDYTYARRRIERRAQPLLALLQAVGLDVSNETGASHSTIRNQSTALSAHIRHADMLLPECRITLTSVPCAQNADANDMGGEQALKIIIRPSAYAVISEDRTLHPVKRTEGTVFTIPHATALLKTYLLRAVPDQCGPLLAAQKSPPPKP